MQNLRKLIEDWHKKIKEDADKNKERKKPTTWPNIVVKKTGKKERS